MYREQLDHLAISEKTRECLVEKGLAMLLSQILPEDLEMMGIGAEDVALLRPMLSSQQGIFTQEQKLVFHAALLSAFPHYTALAYMVRGLDQHLEHITSYEVPLGETVRQLIEWAVKEHRELELLAAARKRNGGNSRLAKFALSFEK